MGRPRTRKSTKAMASLALKKVNLLEKQVEVKNVDFSIVDSTVAQAGFIQELFTISQGDTSETRDGDKVWVKRIGFNYGIRTVAASTVSGAGGYWRLLICKLPQSNTTVAITDILESASVTSLYKKESDVKYNVVFNKVGYLGGATSVNSQIASTQSEYIKIGQTLRIGKGYEADTSGSLIKNKMVVIMLHTHEDEDMDFVLNGRVSYTDM